MGYYPIYSTRFRTHGAAEIHHASEPVHSETSPSMTAASPYFSRDILLRDCSIETTPRDSNVPEELSPGTRVFVASVPGIETQQLVARSAQLAKAGFRPVPHVVARGLTSVDALDERLRRLRGEANAEAALVLGGDTPDVAGPFASARAMFDTGLFAKHGFSSVGFATYAEDHPRIARDLLDAELDLKLASAAQQDLPAFLVSQFCFDPDVMAGHVARLRARGLRAPVSLGIAGPASWKSLAQFALLCGVRNSTRFITSQGRKIGQLLSGYEPGDIIDGVARALPPGEGAGEVRVHFFAFGGLRKTAAWVETFRQSAR